MLREGMVIAERYDVLEKIGSGGMSDVYKARCRKLNRYVAIKVLKSEFSGDKNFVSKFRAEAQSAAGLMHANIVNVYDVGEENGIYYIVMELVEGITLKKYIEKKGRLGVREAVSIAIQVAQGMEAAHNHKIIHRDIKPQNIIISKEGKVKVTDFGIARAATSNTINSAVMGSVHYISPEQARGGYSDDKGDIYSFGIMFFEMLTGRVPFDGETTVAIALQHIQDDMVSPKHFVPEIPISVEKIVLKCTQKKTEKRYQSAMELISDLKRSLVTPDEDFVVISSAVTPDAPTQMIDEEEVALINEKARQKSAGIDVISPIGGTVRSGRVSETLPDEDIVADEDNDNDLDRDVETSKKIDKIIAILGIVVGIVIIIITIIIIVKVADTFSDNSSTTKQPSTTTAQVGDGKVEVPLVIGYTYEQAKEVLLGAGLGIKEIYDFSESYEYGVIFAQSEDEGSRVLPNTTVTVTISKGAATFELPPTIGETQADAERILKNKNLKVSYTYENTTDETKWGKVKSSKPVAGSNVKSGDIITLVIYNSPEVINEEVPELTGMDVSDARKKLTDLGFTNVSLEYEYDDEVAKDKVIALAGAKVGEYADVKTALTLVISKGVDPNKETDAPVETPTTGEESSSKVEETLDFETHVQPLIDEIASAMNKELPLIVRYKAKYKDTDGKTVTEQIAATTYNNYAAVEAVADSKPILDKTLTGSIKPGSDVTILIEIVYNVEKDADGKVVKSDTLAAKEVKTTTTK